MIRASKEVSERKAATQTWFQKLNYPQLNGDVLNYQEFKRRWENEVVPERKPAALELAALRESIPALAKAKIAAITTTDEAWKLLDLDYGNLEEVRAKLKEQVRSLKLKATSGPAKVVELFQQIQIIAAKIKATGSISLLENDAEYVALVGNHLSREVMWEWWKSNKSGWTNFYLFLENTASTAKKQLTAQSIMSALTTDKGDKTKCPTCKKTHSGKCLKANNTAAVNHPNEKVCPVCEKGAHKYKNKAGQEKISKRVKDCPSFKAAGEDKNKH